jgi:hypothetical protein
MSAITEEMHRVASRIYGSDTKTFKLLDEQWNILLQAQLWVMRTGYRQEI